MSHLQTVKRKFKWWILLSTVGLLVSIIFRVMTITLSTHIENSPLPNDVNHNQQRTKVGAQPDIGTTDL